MKKLRTLLLVLVVALMATSCNVRPSKTSNLDKFSKKVTYFQDENTGAVFATVAIKKKLSPLQEGIGLAYIPKAEITPAIKAQIKGYKEF